MNDELLKNNEIMIFTDFNNTLVDFENEYNSSALMYDEKLNHAISSVKFRLTKCLKDFEASTGLTPVICIVTNAALSVIDGNDAPGIHKDLQMTFFNHLGQTKEQAKQIVSNTCEKYFRYLVYKENDVYFKINPLGDSFSEMFEIKFFNEEALKIRYDNSHKKKESVQRIMSVVDPNMKRTKYCIFAGDSIKDDYPMKLIETPEGVCKIFIRPGKVSKLKPSLMHEFCIAKGVEFKSIHPKTGKKIKCFSNEVLPLLSEEDRLALENYNDCDYILLTDRNSKGFIQGLYESIEIIKKVKNAEKNQSVLS